MINRRAFASRFAGVLALVSFGLAASPASRADDAPTNPNPPGVGVVKIGPEIPVVEVLKNLSMVTGKLIIWNDDDKFVATRKILSTGNVFSLSTEKIFDAIVALLAHEEIVLIPFGPPESRMFHAMDARSMASQFMTRVQPEVVEVTEATIPTLLGQAGRFVSATIKVTNLVDLRDARTALQRLVTQNNIGSVQEVPAASAFIVTDFAPNVAAVYQMIQQMDTPRVPNPAKRAAPAYFKLKYARAPRVAQLLSQLFVPTPAVSTQVQGQPSVAPVPGAASPAARIGFDEVTNQVVVIATAEDTATMREIVEHVDVDASR